MLTFDVGKTRTWLYYLGRASVKVKERAIAREKVRVAVKRLKQISTKNIQKDINLLERRISEALKKENQLLTKQKEEDLVHFDLLEKVDLLQKKLGRYLETKDAREERMKKLEDKIFRITQPKKFQIIELKEGLKHLEDIYIEEKKSGEHYPEDLLDIDNKIKLLKSRIKNLEEDYL